MIHRPLRLLLDGEALVSNWRWLRARGGDAACGAAVKADGYSLGAREVVRQLAAVGCRDFFVSTYAEAEALGAWDEGLTLSVLHGPGPDDVMTAAASPARPVLNSPLQVARWREIGEGRPCDVMVDTGMNRLGLTVEEACSGLLDGLVIETLLSHLACADEPVHPLNARQLADFHALREVIPARRYSLANSAGICLGSDYAFDLTRPGLALYGGVPVPADREQRAALRQVVCLEARVVQLRDVAAGQSIGYCADYVAPQGQTIAVVNLGYADGWFRHLAPLGAHWNGIQLPVLGRISMDLTAIAAPLGLAEGDWVAFDLDLPRGTGPLSQYELLTSLGSRFDRIWR